MLMRGNYQKNCSVSLSNKDQVLFPPRQCSLQSNTHQCQSLKKESLFFVIWHIYRTLLIQFVSLMMGFSSPSMMSIHKRLVALSMSLKMVLLCAPMICIHWKSCSQLNRLMKELLLVSIFCIHWNNFHQSM